MSFCFKWRTVSTIFFFSLQECCICIPLSQVIFFEEQAAGIGKRWLWLMHLTCVACYNNTGNLTLFIYIYNLYVYKLLPFQPCSAKIVIHLHPAPENKEPGPYQHSKYSYIKLSFKEHGQIEVSKLRSDVTEIFQLIMMRRLILLPRTRSLLLR